MDWRERVAALLGWSVQDTRGFSMQMLREMVRDKDPKLAGELSTMIQSGSYIFGAPQVQKRRR